MLSINYDRVYGNAASRQQCLPTFNHDRPFAAQLLAVKSFICLWKRVLNSPKNKNIFGAQRLFHVSVCSHFDGECVTCGAGMKDTWLSRGRAAPRYLYRSCQQLCCLMAPLPRGVYWWLPLIPFSWKKHTCRDVTVCVWVCVLVCVWVWDRDSLVCPFSHPCRHSHIRL